MSSSGIEPESPDLVCQLDNVQGVVDALTSVRWKKQQHAVLELSEHGIVLIVEETACLQAKVYLQRELFVKYEYSAEGRPRFGVSLGLFVDCLNTFSVQGHSSAIEIRYPGPDMQLLLKSVESSDSCTYAEIRTRIPDTISWDYNFEPAGSTPLSFTVKNQSTNPRVSAPFICYVSIFFVRKGKDALKEAIDDLEWPGSSIYLILQPSPPSVTFRGEGHGDLQIDFMCHANTDLLVAFHCDRQVSHRYKYKFLRATTSNIPSSVIRDNRGSKLTIGRGGMLKVQHLVSVAKPAIPHPHVDSSGYQQPSRIAYIEFFVKPEKFHPGGVASGVRFRWSLLYCSQAEVSSRWSSKWSPIPVEFAILVELLWGTCISGNNGNKYNLPDGVASGVRFRRIFGNSGNKYNLSDGVASGIRFRWSLLFWWSYFGVLVYLVIVKISTI
ncbi:putative pentatricopeptide repeat-containing protein, mitochondrial-like [Capsicum annuum]|nr:putative pentatricopeptide repeat-containing protein, mitochondrial-like [Capsicum annuum]